MSEREDNCPGGRGGRGAAIRVTLSPSVCQTARTSHLDCSKQPGRWWRSGLEWLQPRREKKTWKADKRDADGVMGPLYLFPDWLPSYSGLGDCVQCVWVQEWLLWTYLRLNYGSDTVRINVIQIDSSIFSPHGALGRPRELTCESDHN